MTLSNLKGGTISRISIDGSQMNLRYFSGAEASQLANDFDDVNFLGGILC